MKNIRIEPGLLNIFRLFAGIRFTLLVVAVGVIFLRVLLFGFPADFTPPANIPQLTIFNFSLLALLLVYLYLPGLQRWLGWLYLPGALLIATIEPLFGQYLRLTSGISDIDPELLITAWQLVVILSVPLILIAWQYRFVTVVFYTLAITFLDISLTTLAIGFEHFLYWPTIGVILVRLALFLLIGYIVSKLMETQRQQRRALTEANTQLRQHAATLEQLTISRERNRLARELHDTLAHTLSGLAVQLEAVDALWETDNPAAKTLLEQSLNTTRSGLTETRRALQDLRASPLEDLGLNLAIKTLAQSITERAGMKLSAHVPEESHPLSPEMEQNIYRIAQEALTNIDRHSAAKQVWLDFNVSDNSINLQVKDDGIGFNLQTLSPNGHIGLKAMAERAEMMGGKLNVESAPGQGTTIHLTVERLND